MMARIIEEAEASIREFPRPATQEQLKVAETVAELVCHASRELHMKLIAVFTHSGFTARLVSRYRPLVPIVAFSPEAETRRRLALLGKRHHDLGAHSAQHRSAAADAAVVT